MPSAYIVFCSSVIAAGSGTAWACAFDFWHASVNDGHRQQGERGNSSDVHDCFEPFLPRVAASWSGAADGAGGNGVAYPTRRAP